MVSEAREKGPLGASKLPNVYRTKAVPGRRGGQSSLSPPPKHFAEVSCLRPHATPGRAAVDFGFRMELTGALDCTGLDGVYGLRCHGCSCFWPARVETILNYQRCSVLFHHHIRSACHHVICHD